MADYLTGVVETEPAGLEVGPDFFRKRAKLTALRALGGPTNCPGFGRLAIAQGHASTLNHAVAASVWSAAQTAENASLYIRDLGNEQAERFGRGLTYLFNDWIERFGPVKDCEVNIRQSSPYLA